MYKYLFGPVPSRRLGMSLGVDLIPHKICSFNCVYCECGRTTTLTNERKEYVPVDDVISELGHYFGSEPAPDYITFSGAGEPTLNSRFGEVLQFIKKNRPGIPVAVLTNGSLLEDAGARKELLDADVVLPSLDAATDKAFHRIDRPYSKLKIDGYIQGLIEFRKEFKGKIWLEIFILPGLNDDIENLDALKIAINKIKPDSIQLNTLDRPGTVENIRPANSAELQHIIGYWGLNSVEIIASAPKRKDIKAYRQDVENAILETISRRPCTIEDLSHILGIHINEINKYLGVIDNEQKIETSNQPRGIFYQLRPIG
ncbi:MAG: radical SAM protein [Bacteroidetes bacterium 4484_276]|nr:MAG: radical SAM protein [Bacteroidetes bacterium 4484_276]